MSQFNEALQKARKKQKLFFILSVAAISLAILTVVLFFVISNGIRFDIAPKEAKELARLEINKGPGLAVGTTAYFISKKPEITISAEGFRSRTVIIYHDDYGKVYPVKLDELPGQLVIETSPALDVTRWQINGKDMGAQPVLEAELEPGDYSITIDNPYYMKKDLNVTILRNEKTEKNIALEPVHGSINITSKPDGASIFLDDEFAGTAPLTLEKQGGEYQLRASLEDHLDIDDRIAITRESLQIERNYRLLPQKAIIRLDLQPAGGKLFLNGASKKTGGELVVDANVTHQLRYEKPGYFSQGKNFTLKPNQKASLSFHLEKDIGKINITSSPEAVVTINNTDYGMTPVSVELPAYAHEITFTKPGYRSVSRTITPTSRFDQDLSVRLLTEYEAALAEAAPQYAHKSGYQLKLFKPNEIYKMGAERHEKGQRANEIVRKVKLTRPFYAGLYEVTQAEYRQFKNLASKSAGNMPVTSITWSEAALFCNWLSREEGLPEFYQVDNNKITGFNAQSKGYRLLTEAEWEWLARKAGRESRTVYTWGDETVIPRNTANIADESAKGQVKFYVPNYNDGYAGVAPAGSFAQEPAGLYDMAGNVSEWVHDVYSIIPQFEDLETNPVGATRSETHVVKGANWKTGTVTGLRPAFREGLQDARDDLGFRVGRYLVGGSSP